MGKKRWDNIPADLARAIRSKGGKAAAKVKSEKKSAASRRNLELARAARLAKRQPHVDQPSPSVAVSDDDGAPD